MPPENLVDVIRTRRTIHDFRTEPVPEVLLLQAIELALWAPNHKLTEPWRFHIIGPETAARLVDLNTTLVRASKGEKAAEEKHRRWSAMPGWFAVSCPRSADTVRTDEDYAACCCAIENLSLFLWSRGVGVKWTTGEITRNPEFLRLLGLEPDRDRIVGLFWYGYPAAIPEQKRPPVDEVLVRWP